MHLTPASSECTQLWEPIALAGQSISLDSVPAHWTLSSQMDPVPAPKAANETAVAPTRINKEHKINNNNIIIIIQSVN